MINDALKSKNIKDYFTAKLTDFTPGRPLDFNIHLFFKQNHHILIFRKKGDILSKQLLNRYLSKGITSVWIHDSDKARFEEYIKTEKLPQGTKAAPLPNQETAPVQVPPEDLPTSNQQVTLTENKAQYSDQIIGLIRNESTDPNDSSLVDDKRKTALLAKSARSILDEAMTVHDLNSQDQANSAARAIVKEILENINTESKSIISELWAAAEMNTELSHAANVASYSVLLALALGKADTELIADLALAGLLHDVGLSQVSLKISSTPWKAFTQEMRVLYAKHVKAGLDIINAYGANIPERVKTMILQHHEKFDGTGYPKNLDGFKIELPSQLLALAELIDSTASGQWDGVKKTYQETLTAIQEMEKNMNFPEHFNPEILSAVMRWTHHPHRSIKERLE